MITLCHFLQQTEALAELTERIGCDSLLKKARGRLCEIFQSSIVEGDLTQVLAMAKGSLFLRGQLQATDHYICLALVQGHQVESFF